MVREGILTIRRLGEGFEVMFARQAAAAEGLSGLLTPCYVAGREALRELLEKKMDISPDTVKNTLGRLDVLKDGVIEYIPGVKLSDKRRFELGLVSPDEGLSREAEA